MKYYILPLMLTLNMCASAPAFATEQLPPQTDVEACNSITEHDWFISERTEEPKSDLVVELTQEQAQKITKDNKGIVYVAISEYKDIDALSVVGFDKNRCARAITIIHIRDLEKLLSTDNGI